MSFYQRFRWKVSIREHGSQKQVLEAALKTFHQRRSDQTISLHFPWSWQADNLSHLGVWRCWGWGLWSWGHWISDTRTDNTMKSTQTLRYTARGCHLCLRAVRHYLTWTCKHGRLRESKCKNQHKTEATMRQVPRNQAALIQAALCRCKKVYIITTPLQY